MKTKIIQNTKSIILALILTLCVGYVSASSTWNNPPAGTVPPANNTDAPINTGASSQFKDGNLWIKAIGLEKGLIVENGNVGIGVVEPTAKLDIAGNIKIVDGNQGEGKVLTSDADGLASWQAGGGGGTFDNSNLCYCIISDANSDTAWKCAKFGEAVTSWNEWPGESNEGGYTGIKIDLCSNMIYGSVHSTSSCTSAGGTIVSNGTNNFCKFTANSCPSGWTKYSNYSTTTASTCTGATGTCTDFTPLTCTTGYHAFGNITAETCTYYNQSKGLLGCPIYSSGKTCTATVNQIGCY
ncbi:MAG: hypothetical protein WCW93_01670 [Candidatus Paceibacterota bacterium]